VDVCSGCNTTIYKSSSFSCMRPEATNISGLKLHVRTTRCSVAAFGYMFHVPSVIRYGTVVYDTIVCTMVCDLGLVSDLFK